MALSLPRWMADGGEVTLDSALTVLSRRRARFICYYLMSEDVSEVNELFLAREVAAWETGTDSSQVATEKVTAVLDELQDETFPELDDIGLIEYNRGTGSVRYGDSPNQFERLLEVCRSIEQPEPPE